MLHVPWTVKHAPWTIDHALWDINRVLWSTEHVLWSIAYVLRSIKLVLVQQDIFYEPLDMRYGSWSMFAWSNTICYLFGWKETPQSNTTCCMDHRAFSMGHRTCSMVHRACSMVHRARACSMVHRTCPVDHKTCSMVHQSCSMHQHHRACVIEHRICFTVHGICLEHILLAIERLPLVTEDTLLGFVFPRKRGNGCETPSRTGGGVWGPVSWFALLLPGMP